MPHLATVRKPVYVKIAASHYRTPRVADARFFAATGAVTSGGTNSAAEHHTAWPAITVEENSSVSAIAKRSSAAGSVTALAAMGETLPKTILRVLDPAKGQVVVYTGMFLLM